MEVQASPAEDASQLWYRQEVILTGLQMPPAVAPVDEAERFAPHPNALGMDPNSPHIWNPIYDPGARQAETAPLDPVFGNIPASAPEGPVLYTLESASGPTQRIGLLGGQSQYRTNAEGVPATFSDPRNDSFNVQGQSLGAFWSLTSQQGWHVDLSASGARVNGISHTDQGQRQAAEGNAMTLSVEGGFAIGISENWVVEPQAQLINQRISLVTPNAAAGNGSSNDLTSWSGRVGASLQGSYIVRGLPVEPYVRTNLWHTVYTGDTVTFDQVDKISSSRNASTVELGLGLVAKVSPTVSLYVSGDYSSDLGSSGLNGLIGNIGVRMRW